MENVQFYILVSVHPFEGKLGFLVKHLILYHLSLGFCETILTLTLTLVDYNHRKINAVTFCMVFLLHRAQGPTHERSTSCAEGWVRDGELS